MKQTLRLGLAVSLENEHFSEKMKSIGPVPIICKRGNLENNVCKSSD